MSVAGSESIGILLMASLHLKKKKKRSGMGVLKNALISEPSQLTGEVNHSFNTKYFSCLKHVGKSPGSCGSVN